MGYFPPKCSYNGNHTSIQVKSCISLLECLHAPSHASSPHRLPHICIFHVWKYVFKTKIFVLFVDNPLIYIYIYIYIYISGHTPINNCVDNPPIYISGHTPINNCWSTLRNHVMHLHLRFDGAPVHMKCNIPFSCPFHVNISCLHILTFLTHN